MWEQKYIQTEILMM